MSHGSSRRALPWLVVLLLAGCDPAPRPIAERAAAAPAPEFGDAFWREWGDGRGELAGYDLEISRYGEPRRGVAVTVFVTETFSNSRRVKSDPGRHPTRDEFPVVKLNLMHEFATGIYDYHLMTSVFTALAPVNGRPAGAPTKISFGAQEWCGHVYAQALFDARYARLTSHSYFDAEADSQVALEVPNDALAEDALWAWARGFSAPLLAPGDSAERPLLGSLRAARLLHRPVRMTTARLRRAAGRERVTVPAGTFTADVRTATVGEERTWTFWVESDEPHRIVQWASDDGERARLLGSERLAYWELNGRGGEAYLAGLGLKPRPPRTQP